MAESKASVRFVAGLGLALAACAVLSAVDCRYPSDFWLENVLVLLAAAYIAVTYSSVPLSRASYVSILAFLCLHEIGAHTTFAEVPYDEWTRNALGRSLNEFFGWERNHYDRLVHFAYGLLLTLPFQETIETHLGPQKPFARIFLPWIFVLATSSAYELIEWAAALIFGGDLGQAYLGTQGDVWDSHKDTGLAIAGAALFLTGQALSVASRRAREAFNGTPRRAAREGDQIASA